MVFVVCFSYSLMHIQYQREPNSHNNDNLSHPLAKMTRAQATTKQHSDSLTHKSTAHRSLLTAQTPQL